MKIILVQYFNMVKLQITKSKLSDWLHYVS